MFAYAYKMKSSVHSEALTCVGTLQEQCASEDFLRGWDHWNALRLELGSSNGKESVAEREQLSDEFGGLTQRLQGMVPKGSQWDEKKRRFVLITPSNPPTSPVVAPPLPAK
jgi:hypothetical protein